MWNLQEASQLINELQSSIRNYGYHVLLGGGVINNGFSYKDLDLFFIPLNGYKGEKVNLINFLFDRFGILEPIRDSPDYIPENNWHYNDMLTNGKYNEKRIDFFIQ